VVDPAGSIRFANPAAEALFALTRDELQSREFGYPVIKGEYSEINIVSSTPHRVAEMRTIDFDWEGGTHFLTSIRDISERKAAELKIQHELAEKRTLLQELYHRTKNNMNVISSLLSLTSARYGSPEVRELVQGMEDRIQAMSLVHQMLYQSENLSQIALSRYLHELATLMIQGQGEVTRSVELELSVDEIGISIEKSIPLGLVLNELISNSLEHAFPGGRRGRITIRVVRSAAATLEIAYADNGIGLPAAFNPEAGDSLGMRLINILVKNQLNGRIGIRGGNGFSCDISIPFTG